MREINSFSKTDILRNERFIKQSTWFSDDLSLFDTDQTCDKGLKLLIL